MSFQRLQIYLNDHLALIMGELELLSRCEKSNQGSPLAITLATVRTEVKEQQEVVRDALASTEGHENIVKQAAAWFAEKLGRLKVNDSLVSYSSLSRLLELEALSAAAHERVALWETIEQFTADDPRFLRQNWTRFREQSERHRKMLDDERRIAAQRMFRE